jgi:hypothetical protein
MPRTRARRRAWGTGLLHPGPSFCLKRGPKSNIIGEPLRGYLRVHCPRPSLGSFTKTMHLERKALQFSRRAYQQPIASEPVRHFGRGHAPGATPMRSPSVAGIDEVCDPSACCRSS